MNPISHSEAHLGRLGRFVDQDESVHVVDYWQDENQCRHDKGRKRGIERHCQDLDYVITVSTHQVELWPLI